jgi:hypothetical protein
LWTEDPETSKFVSSSRYLVVIALIEAYIRYIGPMIIFLFGGFTYLLFKIKSKSEFQILLFIISVLLLLYVPTYTKWFILSLFFIVIGVGLRNLIVSFYPKYKKLALIILMILLLFSSTYSGYFQFLHFDYDSNFDFRSMNEKTYSTSLWVENNVEGNLFWNSGLVGLRVLASSGKPVLFGGPNELAYKFTDISYMNITKNSPFSSSYYEDGPYIKTPGTPYTEGYINQLSGSEFDSKWGTRLISAYNISYVLDANFNSNTFITSIRRSENSLIYDNGQIGIWYLNDKEDN